MLFFFFSFLSFLFKNDMNLGTCAFFFYSIDDEFYLAL
ncbi:unnamed protein product [Coffea canephora]|uniref:DH200=94 genomic scaffold, scaffold_455 n=1 Tax=Coffea canephora TaxID=49390 RepID=A0A068VFK1_COFCA|nr:unnamed protein product [Coffea canephora]